MPLRISLYPVNRYIILPHIDHPCLAPIYIYMCQVRAWYILLRTQHSIRRNSYCSPVPVAMRGGKIQFFEAFFFGGVWLFGSCLISFPVCGSDRNVLPLLRELQEISKKVIIGGQTSVYMSGICPTQPDGYIPDIYQVQYILPPPKPYHLGQNHQSSGLILNLVRDWVTDKICQVRSAIGQTPTLNFGNSLFCRA